MVYVIFNKMKKFQNISAENLSEIERNELLLSLIPKLKRFKSASGSEGTAYFIGENLIVKEYDKIKDKALLNSIFEAYCEEAKTFSTLGYQVPQIFAWTKSLSRPSIFQPKEQRCFILEEQIPGRELFLDKLDSLYNHLATYNTEYARVVRDYRRNPSLHREMVKSYIEDFIYVNGYIEAMSDADMFNFIDSLYHMFEKAEYCIPDIHRKNVIISNGGGLKVIDNYMSIKKDHSFYGDLSVEEFLFSRLVYLFNPNGFIDDYFVEYGFKKNMPPEFQDLVGKNRIICDAAIERVLKAMKIYLDGKQVENVHILRKAYSRLAKILDYNRAGKLMTYANADYLGMWKHSFLFLWFYAIIILWIKQNC